MSTHRTCVTVWFPGWHVLSVRVFVIHNREISMSSETDEQVAHHAEVLMWHDTGSGTFASVAQQYAELFRKFVPDTGAADTDQGKVILAVSRLAGEYRRNGNINWGPFYEEFVETLEAMLVPAQAETEDRERVQRNLDSIRENGTQELGLETMRLIFGECIEDAVRYAADTAT